MQAVAMLWRPTKDKLATGRFESVRLALRVTALCVLASTPIRQARAATASAVVAEEAGGSADERSRVAVDRQTSHLDRALCGLELGAVRLVGLRRTRRRVVLRELLVRVGGPADCGALRETVQRLRNLGVFRRVQARLAASADAGATRRAVDLTLVFDEKWTLLPIVSAGRGGGRLYLLAGAQDSHLAGRLLQLQAYWYLFAGTHSATISIADPRLWHRRFRAAVAFEHGNRNRYRYRHTAAPYAAWSRHRERISLTLSDLRDPKHASGVQLHGVWDRFTTRLLSPSLRLASANEAVARDSLPVDGLWLLPRVWTRWGRVDRDDYLESNGFVELALSAGVPISTALRPHAWGRVALVAKWAWLPPAEERSPGGGAAANGASARPRAVRAGLARLNVVAQARLGAQLGGHPEQRFFVGGLTAVRGYWEGRFAGEQMAAANLEARLPSWHGRWLVLQHVAFVDAGWARDTTTPGRPWQGGAAVGAGLRVILPLIAQFVARLDVAWAITDGDWRVSFGSQQFF